MLLLPFLIFSLSLVGVYSEATRIPNRLKLAWSNCGTASDPVKITQFNISPEPLNIPGMVTLNASVQFARNISAPIKADVTVKKKSFIGWIEVPCVDNKGSCTYEDLCALSPFKEPCPLIFKVNNIPCICPINKGFYSVKDFHFPIKAIGPHWLEHGKYQVRISLSKEDHLLGCYEFQLNLK